MPLQTTQDPSELLADARFVKPVYDTFIAAVASKSAGRILHSKIKGRYRIAEKIALRPPAQKKRFPGACAVRDVVRGAIVYNSMGELNAGFNLIVGSDAKICAETYSAAEAAGLTTRIVLRGMTASRWMNHRGFLFCVYVFKLRNGLHRISQVSRTVLGIRLLPAGSYMSPREFNGVEQYENSTLIFCTSQGRLHDRLFALRGRKGTHLRITTHS